MDLIRRARPTDAADIGRVYVESWRRTYPGLIPDHYLLSLSADSQALRWRARLTQRPDPTPIDHGYDRDSVFVAIERLHGLVGFTSCGRQRDPYAGHDGYDGEIYTLYLLDDAQGRGLGRRLMAAAATELLARGHASGLVWVLRDNPARWFYERLGGARLGERDLYLGRTLLPGVAYGWRDLSELARLPVNPPLE